MPFQGLKDGVISRRGVTRREVTPVTIEIAPRFRCAMSPNDIAEKKPLLVMSMAGKYLQRNRKPAALGVGSSLNFAVICS